MVFEIEKSSRESERGREDDLSWRLGLHLLTASTRRCVTSENAVESFMSSDKKSFAGREAGEGV